MNPISEDSEFKVNSPEQFYNYLAIWILEFGYGYIDPPQKEIDRVEKELYQIEMYEKEHAEILIK